MYKVLLDHDIPHRLRHDFPADCAVYTTYYMGWSQLDNGDLMEAAKQAAFDVFITLDRSIAFQQNLEGAAIGVIFLRVYPAKLPKLRRLMPQIVKALPEAAQGRHLTVLG